jgi:hypothetical protein
MSEPRYFRYIVAQYVHSRREERLNVGVIVHDPVKAVVRSRFDTRTATRRIKNAFPDIDARGLTVFLKDLSEAVLTNPQLNAAVDKDDALAHFGDSWRNAIQFTPVRAMPAENITAALDALSRLYVAEIPTQLHQVPLISGIPYARDRTRQALRDVLHLEEGVGYVEYRGEQLVTFRGRQRRLPIEFPFFVFDEFVIDTLSFRGDSYREKFNMAAGFADKVKMLRRSQEGRSLIPCVSYVTDEDRIEETEGLIAHLQTVTDMPDERVVEASQASELAKYIQANRRVA